MFPVLPAIAFGALAIALLSDNRGRQAAPAPSLDRFGAVPPPPASMASGASVLRSAGLAAPGSWTQRNVLAAGAQSAYARRLAGTATEADFAVLSAARPGIASGLSGPISPAWTGSPWQPGPGVGPGPRSSLWSRIASGANDTDDIDDIDEDDIDEFGANPYQSAWETLSAPVQAAIKAFIQKLKAAVPGIQAYEVRAGEDVNRQRYGVVTITAHDPHKLLGPVSNALMNAIAPYGVSTTMTPLSSTPGQIQFTFSMGAIPIDVTQETGPQIDTGESPSSYGFFY